MEAFNRNLSTYAELIIRTGINLQPGQRLFVRSPIEGAGLSREISRAAYRAGCELVSVIFSDEAQSRIRVQETREDYLDAYPDWLIRSYLEGIEAGDAFLTLYGENPELLAGLDEQRCAHIAMVKAQKSRTMQRLIMKPATQWCVAGVPVESWATRIFPDSTPSQAIERLWEAIFRMCRVDEDSPIEVWKEHVSTLLRRKQWLDEMRFDRLHFRAPGTDLEIGLVNNHRWLSGTATSEAGTSFVPNIPTEEVFTLPDRLRVNGTVTASRPLAFNGQLIDGFSLRFEDGSVVEAHAERGQAALEALLDSDEGARRLGEVALVPHSSRVGRENTLFLNTLFDENAATHIALGAGYRFNMENGASLSEEDFAAAGGNLSMKHEDFMIGSAEMSVEGTTPDGRSIQVMDRGEWVHEA